MALLFLDSFDHYATADGPAKYLTFGGTTTIVAGGGRRASGALHIGSNNPVVAAVVPGMATAIVGFAFKINTFGSPAPYISIRSGSNMQVALTPNGSGFLQAYRGPNLTALLGTATTGPLSTGVFAFIELKVVIHATAGSVVVRVNEAEVINVSGVNTLNSGASWDNVQLNGGSSVLTDFDDFYILDGAGSAPLNNFLGDCRVDVRLPTAAGATTGWTPSAGANWAAVDDAAPNGDTDYVSAATSPLTDTYTIQDAPVPGAVLYGVQLCASLKKSDAGTCSVAPVVRHGGVDYPGTAVNPGTAYAFAVVPYGTNPGTGAAWTEADFNAAEFGIKRTA